MSDSLPPLGELSEPQKYERLVERLPDVWWNDAGPFAGLHQLNVARVDYFRRVFGGFGGKRALDVGCGGGILARRRFLWSLSGPAIQWCITFPSLAAQYNVRSIPNFAVFSRGQLQFQQAGIVDAAIMESWLARAA